MDINFKLTDLKVVLVNFKCISSPSIVVLLIFICISGSLHRLWLRENNKTKISPGSTSKERLSISMSSRLDAALQKSSRTQCTAWVTL